MKPTVPSDSFIPHAMPKPWNHLFDLQEIHTFRRSRALFRTPNFEHLEFKLAPLTTTVAASSPSVANRGAHQTVPGLVLVHRTVNIAILSCQVTSTVSSLPMLLPSYEVKGSIGHFHASFYFETMASLALKLLARKIINFKGYDQDVLSRKRFLGFLTPQ